MPFWLRFGADAHNWFRNGDSGLYGGSSAGIGGIQAKL